jgi:hypothetical protein
VSVLIGSKLNVSIPVSICVAVSLSSEKYSVLYIICRWYKCKLFIRPCVFTGYDVEQPRSSVLKIFILFL